MQREIFPDEQSEGDAPPHVVLIVQGSQQDIAILQALATRMHLSVTVEVQEAPAPATMPQNAPAVVFALPAHVTARLTPREQDVARLLRTGRTNLQIAQCLFIEETTVKKCLYILFRRFNLANRSQFVAYLHNEDSSVNP